MTATRPGPLAIIRWLLDLAILGLVAVVLFAVILGRLVPLMGGQTLIIGGPSMEPTMPLGSAVVIQPVATEAIAVGDIVSVRSAGGATIFTHRVVRLLALDGVPFLETKGDNNPTPDGATVPAAAVIGRVAWNVPLMGYVIALLSVPIGVAFVLGLGALMILGALLVDTLEGDRHGALALAVRPRSKDPELGVEPRGPDTVPRPPRPSRQTRPTARRRSTRPTP